MKLFLIVCLSFFTFTVAIAQKPKDGIYTYSIAFAEWQGKSLGATCTVIIKNDSVYVVHNGKSKMTGNTGDLIDAGIIMKHISGKWIISHNANDKNADEVGGCSDGPTVIDFKRKKVWSC